MNVEPAPALAPASAPSFTDNGGFNEPSTSTSTTSFLLRALLVVLLLGLIGFNVFSYFDEIIAWLSETFGAPFRAVARFLGYAAADTAKTTVDVTAQGTKSAVDIAAGAATSGINVLQQTIESQGDPILAKLQAAWIEHQVPQCGYCQSGMLMAATALLRQNPRPTDSDIDDAMTNICRCGTYQRVRAAIHSAAGTKGGQ